MSVTLLYLIITTPEPPFPAAPRFNADPPPPLPVLFFPLVALKVGLVPFPPPPIPPIPGPFGLALYPPPPPA